MMKKIVCFSLFCGLIVSLASAQTTQVTSKNAVGYVKVVVPGGKYTIVAVPFDSMSASVDGLYTLDELIGTNLTADSTSTKADEILLWTGSATGYRSAFLNDDGWGDPSINWKWCYIDEQSGEPFPCADNRNYDVQTGQGFWIMNRHDGKTLYLMGEVPSASNTPVAIGSGLTMIANPYPVTRDLDQLITTNNGAYANSTSTKADQILIWTGAGYTEAFLNDDGWGDPSINWKWCYIDEQSGEPAPCTSNEVYLINPGQGFWYLARGGSFVWDVTRPYNINDL